MNSKRLWRHVAVSLIAAVPAGGFLFGLLNAGDPDSNPIGRFFYACLMAFMTPIHAGFPPRSEAGVGQSFNVWPQITIAGLLIFGRLIYRDRRKSKTERKEPNQPPEPTAAADPKRQAKKGAYEHPD